MKIRITTPADGVTVGQTYDVLAMNALNYQIKGDSGQFVYVPKKNCKEVT